MPTATPAVLSPLRDFDNGPWVEQAAPQLASSIKELSWLRDGITSTETGVIQNLLYVAVVSRPVASAIVSLDWVQDGVDGVEAGAIDWMSNIGDAEVASAVVSLSWVQDGIDDVEVKTIEELSYIANEDTKVGLSVVSLDWVQDGVDDLEAGAIGWMNNFGDAEVASAVASLGWLQDGIDDVEVKTIEELSYIASKDTGVGLSVVALDWVQDGVEGVEADAIDWMSNFGDAEVASSVVSLGWVQDGVDDVEAGAIAWMSNFGDAEVASSVVSLGWVQDGIDDVEVKTIEELSYIAYENAEVGLSVVALDWVQDGVDDVEAGAIDWMSNFGDAEVASSVVSLGWMQDGIDDVEVKTIEELSYIAYENAEVGLSVVALDWVQDGVDDVEAGAIDWMSNFGDAEVASAVVSLGWVQDGIDDVEVKTIENLSYIANEDTRVGLSMVSLGWVQDGIDDVEAGAIDWMTNIESAEVASAIVSLGWVQDGIGSLETQAIEEISYLSNEHPVAALSIVGMPFIETIEPPDISAVASLWQLAADDLGSFEIVMSHAALRNGISDDLAPIVATLHGVADTNPGVIDVLLDSSKVLLERRTITLPLSGDVILVIIRTSPGTERSMDLLEHSVRGAEEYMGAPLPTNYVGLLYENAVPESAVGANFGTHITILPEYDIDGSTIAHEVAHYYWSGNVDWVNEGAAEFMASIVERDRTGRPIDAAYSPPCAHARNIVELENLEIAQGDIGFGCNYSLGERLFLDLQRTLGEAQFQEGFWELYIASAAWDDNDGNASIGIEHVREAFRLGDGAADAVIARWYDGTEPYDLSSVDTGPVDPGLPSINGRIDKAYIATATEGPAVSRFSAKDATDWVYLTLESSYNVSGGPHEVALEIVEYYEDGFVFRRSRSKLTAEAKYVNQTNWFSIGPPPGEWAPGRYVVYVYAGERKVAEVKYEVLP